MRQWPAPMRAWTVRWASSRPLAGIHHARSVARAHMHRQGQRSAPSVPRASRTTTATRPPPVWPVCRVDTRRQDRTAWRVLVRWAASAARLATRIWMVRARHAQYVRPAGTRVWARRRARRVRRGDTIMTRRQYRHPPAHRACHAMWGTTRRRAPWYARTVRRGITTTIEIHRRHVMAMRGNAAQGRTRVLRREGARLVQLAATITTRIRRQRARRVQRARMPILVAPVACRVQLAKPIWIRTLHPNVWTVLKHGIVLSVHRHACLVARAGMTTTLTRQVHAPHAVQASFLRHSH